MCEKYNSINSMDFELLSQTMKEILGSVGENVFINQRFNCDNGKNVHIGNDSLSNFNLTILDIAPCLYRKSCNDRA